MTVPLATRGRAFAPRLAIRDMAARVDAATPAGRDRSVDALRALAIAGVILGHWLVTALVLTRSPSGARLHDASPLAAQPALTPASWIFQTLAIFFFVGGYAAARGGHTGASYLAWLRGRLSRLSRPVAVLAAVWVPLTAAMALGGVSTGDDPHSADAGPRPVVVPGRVRRAHRPDPASPKRWSAAAAPRPRSSPPPLSPGWTWPGSASALPAGSAGSMSGPAGWFPTCSGSPGRAGRCAAGRFPPPCSPPARRAPRCWSSGPAIRPAWWA